ncbi:pilus assembly protein [Burkholderia cepacia]|uniref:Pilus assembly protein n=1 Tax=Burkholderia cepacia TaxID=292 RepID=A0A2S8IV53_BURCE|nr:MULTISPECIES: type 4 pilus major pilin [Burkholderia]EKS9883120.1 pilus assembly protein [Burkholderia pyrrocinia]EKS9895042.1 pilus assembly protein [Burkholderia pyrrocinia]EKS9907465.1 pilus assembly protein [Burkholderia pyrrocinia]KFL54868.1 pilus assembly protein [Burkholderia pyrrocinia]PQP18671.1 pilus assembly protein [Burkholderia cepacia]
MKAVITHHGMPMRAKRRDVARMPPPAWGPAHPGAALQRGASLLEAISYLGIAAIVVIGAIALLAGAFSSANTNSITEQVNAIQSGVKKLYMGQSASYANLSNSVLASAGVFPSTLAPASGSGAITNMWNGTITVAAATNNSNQFTITYTNVPRSVCVNSVTAGGSWISITVNETALTLPATPDSAATACASGDTNTVAWTST